LTKQVRDAVTNHDEAVAYEVNHYCDLFKTNPAAALRGLSRTAMGCRELIADFRGSPTCLFRTQLFPVDGGVFPRFYGP
jgi:hypothetical protein